MAGLIRCFIAVELPQNVLSSIEGYVSQLKPLAPDIRWVRSTGIHITLKFLGEIPESLVEQVRDKLVPIRISHKSFELTVQDSGFFPSSRNPRVIWIGLEQDSGRSLFKLHQWIDDVLAGLNFAREKRRFSPHITLGRIKKQGDFTRLFSYLKSKPFPETTIFVNTVYLMRSILKPQGAEYSVIESYPLSD